MKKYIFISIIVVLFSMGCQDDNFNTNSEDISTNKLSLQEYTKLLRIKKSAGSILIQANDNAYTQTLIETQRNLSITELETIGSKNKSDLKVNLLDENKNTITYAFNNKQNVSDGSKAILANLYGREIEYTISSKNSKGGENKTIYIPELLNVSINTPEIEAGTVINWNIDPKNKNGLVVWFEYDPLTQNNLNLAYKNQEKVRKGFTIEDIGGTYTVKESDLNLIPNNALATINIARAGFDFTSTSSSDDDVLAVMSLTKVELERRVSKSK